MAATVEGSTLTRTHKRAQLAIKASHLKRVVKLHRSMDLEAILTAKGWAPFEDALVSLIKLNRRESAALASRYYRAFREAEGVPGKVAPKLVHGISEDALRVSLRYAGPGTVQRVLRTRALDVAPQLLTNLSGTSSRHVLDAGRGTLMTATRQDPRARGYSRIPGGSACSFCQMLAARGPVYSEEGVDFRAHNHCACSVEPHFGGGRETWPKEAVDAQAMWSQATKGLRGDDARLAFRRAVEGR